MTQTQVQTRRTVRYGSAKVLIGDRFDNLIDIGAARSIALKETMSTADIESDNAGTITTLQTEHKIELTLDSLEINFKNYAMARGGIDNIDEYDGKTEVTKEYIVESDTYKRGEEIKVPFKNADGSEVTITKVEKKNSMGNILIEESSYEKIGTNGIKITDSKISPSTDTLIITYTRIMPKMVRMTTGGKSSKIKPKCIMIVNTNAEGKQLRIYLPQASIAGGLEFSFPSDKAQDVLIGKLSFSATLAGSQKSGEQLACYEDEQAVSDDEEDEVIKDELTLEANKESLDLKVGEAPNVNLTSNADTIDYSLEPTEQDYFDAEYNDTDKIFTITGKKAGKAVLKIIAKKAGCEDKIISIPINVVEALTLSANKESLDLRVGEKPTLNLTSNADTIDKILEPDGQDYFDAEYADKVFTVTGKKAGNGILKVIAKKAGNEDMELSIPINVVEALTLSANKESLDLRVGEKPTINLTSNADEITYLIEPEEQGFIDVEYNDADKVFTITGKAAGTVTLKITAKKAGNEDKQLDIVINVAA
ncbi:hypothetical protein [Brachyspira hyodysenteriae]|uniref:hypothetical protein n=1 Tax=Brachyspira hyodysenteriae TaxID=159 RepID=UPI00037EE2AB|nr:hypothetical protein [Brachyspira hyodysenteriae]MCZ9920406.1 hypothetical protein [Brachyspira hyodysenteriae]MCZ9924211.1 hypothetical protein [Brachyspira hyodysenteriae]MDA0024067.1 hypothetical protein [Brachyspira hyodysenteriae]MDA0064505.1 hypothetical protein [Brachyspira hyodysenteriae]MDA0064515.1 hypothetical protein [Brachyspira hyodysenteriae]